MKNLKKVLEGALGAPFIMEAYRKKRVFCYGKIVKDDCTND